uniref:ARID DNA-binding domain-containing protein n=1 Tax=Tanacetum cinerariifolium TaxID=118510 RepID=A0A699JFM9_TANCI|nr:ARID DNA-binding domain-containing protein [Tanacetum cinerariifolium]
MVNLNPFLENKLSRPSTSAYGLSNIWYQSKLGRPLRKRLQQSFIQRQMKREKENQIGNCIKQITLDCKDMLRRKLEEIELYNFTINQNKHKRHKCFKCKQSGHILRTCPMNGKSKDKEAKKDTSLGGYLSVYFGQEFGTIGEILGLSKQDREEQEYNCILNNPTKKVEEDIERICPMSHQWDFDETCAPLKTTADQKGKEKLEHFRVKLEDTEDGEDSQPQPIQSHYTRNQEPTRNDHRTINFKKVRQWRFKQQYK